jgi:hypothetical protein
MSDKETTTPKENKSEAKTTTTVADTVETGVTPPPAAAKLAARKTRKVGTRKPAPAPAPVASPAPPPPVAPLAEVTPASTAPANPAKQGRHKKPAARKAKLVRDSFTFPETDYALFATLKQRTLAAGVDIKKSELVRAGLSLLNGLTEDDLVKALGSVERIKTGRPKK